MALTLDSMSQLLDTKLAPVTHKVELIEKRMDTQEQRMGKVEEQLNARPNGTSAGSSVGNSAEGAAQFVPTYVEIKNFCKYDIAAQWASRGTRQKIWLPS